MHRATWQVDLDNDAELSRRARYAETEAQGRIACTNCGGPAQVFTRCDAMRFSAPQCDACGLQRLQYAAIARATVSFDKLAGVDLPMTIDDIDLAQLVVDVLNCAVGDHSIESIQNVPDAVAAVVAVLGPKIHRALLPSEQAAVIAATRVEFVARINRAKSDLRQTQTSLANPFRMFVA